MLSMTTLSNRMTITMSDTFIYPCVTMSQDNSHTGLFKIQLCNKNTGSCADVFPVNPPHTELDRSLGTVALIGLKAPIRGLHIHVHTYPGFLVTCTVLQCVRCIPERARTSIAY